MKKTVLIMLLLGVANITNASTLNDSQKEKVLNKIAQLEHVNGYDVQDNLKLVNTGSDEEVKAYLVELTYNAQKEIDNPNSLDLVDLRASLENKTIEQLTQ